MDRGRGHQNCSACQSDKARFLRLISDNCQNRGGVDHYFHNGIIQHVQLYNSNQYENQSTGTERDPLKLATFNINNINKRLDNLLAWLAKAEPDVVSLQELKAEQEAFPVNALRTLGYEAVWQGGKLGTDGTFPSFQLAEIWSTAPSVPTR